MSSPSFSPTSPSFRPLPAPPRSSSSPELTLPLAQSAKHFGATVIGTTSTEEKAEIARKAGADHVILYHPDNYDDLVKQVYAITGGEGIDRGVHGVFDGVGKDTFEIDFELLRRCVRFSLLSCFSPPPLQQQAAARLRHECRTDARPSLQERNARHPRKRLRPRSLLLASEARPEEPQGCVSIVSLLFPFQKLTFLRSLPLAVARPVLNQYVHTREEFQSYATELFQLVKDGVLNLAVHGEYPLTTDGVRQTQRDISTSLPSLSISLVQS